MIRRPGAGDAVHYAAMFPSRFALVAVAAVLLPLSARAQDLPDLKASAPEILRRARE